MSESSKTRANDPVLDQEAGRERSARVQRLLRQQDGLSRPAQNGKSTAMPALMKDTEELWDNVPL